MRFLIKRIYEPAAETDGFRVLVDRLWPRGVSKAKAKLDIWMPDVGPSTALRQWFDHDPVRWTEFRGRYHAELKKKAALLATIKRQTQKGPVTLLYSAKDERHNQAVALRSLLTNQAVLLRRKRRYVPEGARRKAKSNATLGGKERVAAVHPDSRHGKR
ncbi:MAG: DUF488 domain-containing protein [Nitrospira sp.]